MSDTLVEIQGARASVLSARRIVPGRTIVVKNGKGKARVKVLSCRPRAQGGFVLSGTTPDSPQLSLPDGPPTGVRRSPRGELRARVMSAQIPAFRAITLDCSLTGLLLETEGPVEPGQRPMLEVEFEGPDGARRMVGVAVWCQQEDPRHWHVAWS